MLVIVQSCPAPDCDAEVRYVSSHAAFSHQVLGACGGCGRKFRLVNGRPAEIGRSRTPSDKPRRSKVTVRGRGVARSSGAEAS